MRKALIAAEWMIANEIGCCLRPSGIVLNEQLRSDGFYLTANLGFEHNILCHIVFCSFITNPYGRVQAVSVAVIHAAGRY